MGNRSGISATLSAGQPELRHGLCPSHLTSQTGGQGHRRLWFLCGLFSRIQFPDARHFPSSRPLHGEPEGGAAEVGVPRVWNLTAVTLEVQAPASISPGLGLG